MENKTCMVTGHRELAEEKLDYVIKRLEEEVLQAIAEGYSHFVSGFAQGSDLLFAHIVAEHKATYPITLEAALPYRKRIKSKDETFQRLLALCDFVTVHTEVYGPGCFFKRNRAMLQAAQRVIAVYDGREKGGTVTTLRYAHALEREIRIIEI